MEFFKKVAVCLAAISIFTMSFIYANDMVTGRIVNGVKFGVVIKESNGTQGLSIGTVLAKKGGTKTFSAQDGAVVTIGIENKNLQFQLGALQPNFRFDIETNWWGSKLKVRGIRSIAKVLHR